MAAIYYLTIVLAFTGFVFAFLAKPRWGLGAYCFLLFCYPQNVPGFYVDIAGANFSVSRFVILGLWANFCVHTQIWRQFNFRWMDGFVLAFVFFKLVALSRTVGPALGADMFLMREAGRFFDTVLAYGAARLIVREKADLIALIKALVYCALPLALLGIYEAKTGFNIIRYIYGWGGWMSLEGLQRSVMGMTFYRASATMLISIIFGLFFAAVIPAFVGLWHQGVWPKALFAFLCCFLMLGLMSSMSSAPLFSISVSGGMIAVFHFRRYWPAMLGMFAAALMFVEVFSNRHFYEVLTGLSLNPQTAYYRVGLWMETLGGGMSGHWLTGYGYVGIERLAGNYNEALGFHWVHQDMTNVYIAILVRYGLIGVVPFICAHFLMYKRLYQAGKAAATEADKWLIWCISAGMVGWGVAFMTVGALQQVRTLLFIMMGLSADLPRMMRAAAGGAAADAPPPHPRARRRSMVRPRRRRRVPLRERIKHDKP